MSPALSNRNRSIRPVIGVFSQNLNLGDGTGARRKATNPLVTAGSLVWNQHRRRWACMRGIGSTVGTRCRRAANRRQCSHYGPPVDPSRTANVTNQWGRRWITYTRFTVGPRASEAALYVVTSAASPIESKQCGSSDGAI